jgi:hypothetical protein
MHLCQNEALRGGELLPGFFARAGNQGAAMDFLFFGLHFFGELCNKARLVVVITLGFMSVRPFPW